MTAIHGRPARSFAVLALVLIGMWLAALYLGLRPEVKAYSNQPVSDALSGINALFAGIAVAGVILTLFLQMHEAKIMGEELEKTAQANLEMVRANVRMATRADERAVLDLFQTYCSEYFQVVKDSSMSVLIPCVASKDYCDFVVSRLFVADQLLFPPGCWEKVSRVSRSRSLDEFVLQEQRDRYKLDELINFFTLLVGLSNSREAIARCDFSYSWWRPLLWMIAIQQEKRYAASETVRKYATPLYLKAVVQGLDEIYGMAPFSTDGQLWDFFVNHPKLASHGMDERYRELAIGRETIT
ncbi:hypothetical protein [Massilia glaciei]|nr:hypothetical protein [Massilia glaciei]